MRTTVALVEARPETILEDYRRVLDLAGLADLGVGSTPALIPSDTEGCPGFGNPPWQVDGVTGALGLKGRDQVVPIVASGEVRSLAAGDGPASVLLLPVPRLETGWGVRCCVALLGSLYGIGISAALKPAGFELIVRALGRVRGRTQRLGAVADGTLWGWGGGTLGKGFIQRNVLLAGQDPVAVDAVACRLAGLDPVRIPWLRFCAERGAGAIDPALIKIAGHQELLADPFSGGKLLGTPVRGRWSAAFLRDRLWRLFRRRGLLKSYAETPWGRLDAHYRGGMTSPGGS